MRLQTASTLAVSLALVVGGAGVATAALDRSTLGVPEYARAHDRTAGALAVSAEMPDADAAGHLRSRLRARDGRAGPGAAADFDSGRAAEGYSCNAEEVGHSGTTGGFKTFVYTDGRGTAAASTTGRCCSRPPSSTATSPACTSWTSPTRPSRSRPLGC